jgi:adenylosuccinate synthase
VVLDPDTLFDEIDGLVKAGVDVEGRLYVSERAHLVLPYHKAVDGASASSKAIGTTGRGIGPAYEDKVGRRGVRVLDLHHPERLRAVVEKGAEHARSRLARNKSDAEIDVDTGLHQPVDLVEQSVRIEHHAVADRAAHAGVQDAARDLVQHEGAIAEVHGVARVGAALIPHDPVGTLGEHVHELPLPLVPPLRADDDHDARFRTEHDAPER